LGPFYLGATLNYAFQAIHWEDLSTENHTFVVLASAQWQFEGLGFLRPFVGVDIGGGVLHNSYGGSLTDDTPLFTARARPGLAVWLGTDSLWFSMEGIVGLEISDREWPRGESLVLGVGGGITWAF